NLGLMNTSAVVNITIDALPSVTLISPANNTAFAPPADITLEAAASDPDGTVAKVEFFEGGVNKLGEATSSPYTFQWNSVPLGRYVITAKATDNLGASSTSTAIIVLSDGVPTVSITSPSSGANFFALSNIVVTATASDGDGVVQQVDFYADNMWIGASQTAPY